MVSSLRRFKDDVSEVKTGFECGIGLSDFQDLKHGDVIETYELTEKPYRFKAVNIYYHSDSGAKGAARKAVLLPEKILDCVAS